MDWRKILWVFVLVLPHVLAGDTPRLRIRFIHPDNMPMDDPIDELLESLMPSSASHIDSDTRNILNMMPNFGGDLPLLSHVTGADSCRNDMMKLCPKEAGATVADGTNKYFRCMAQHRTEISQECHDSVKKHVPYICGPSISSTNCDGLESSVLVCLKENSDLLDPDCRFAVETTLATVAKINASHHIYLMDPNGAILQTLKKTEVVAYDMFQFLLFVLAAGLVYKCYVDRAILIPIILNFYQNPAAFQKACFQPSHKAQWPPKNDEFGLYGAVPESW